MGEDIKKTDAQVYIKQKIEDTLVIYKKLIDRQGIIHTEITDTQQRVKSMKDNGKGFEDMVDSLGKIQEFHYEGYLIDSYISKVHSILYEFLNMSVILKFENVQMSQDDKAICEGVLSNNPHLYYLEKGELKMKEIAQMKSIREMINKTQSKDSILQKMFNSIK